MPAPHTTSFAEGDQGLLLLAILSWYGRWEPFTGCDLATARSIAAWQKSLAEDNIISLRRPLRDDPKRVEALIKAAVEQEFWLSDDKRAHLISAPVPMPVFGDLWRSRLRLLTSLADPIADIYRSFVLDWSSQLDRALYEYRRDAPRPVTRVMVVAGLLGGAVAFFLGVISPLTLHRVSNVLYAWIPAAWYFIVLTVICLVAIRRARDF